MKTTLSVIAAAGLLAAPAAQAQDAAVFKPAGGWTADYGDDYCRLIRTFSNGSDEISLALERTQPGAATKVILVGDAIKAFRGSTELGYALLPGGEQKTMFVRSQTADGKQYLSFDMFGLASFAPPPAGAPPAGSAPPAPGAAPVIPPYNRAMDQDAAGKVSAIGLSEGLTAPVRIETGSLKAPIAAMQACADDLLKVWGLDPDKHKAMTALPVMNPSPEGVLPQGTIPFDQFDKFGGGANQVRLLIGADGKPTACAIYAASLSPSLNDKICKLAMARASFQPAKDAGGQAMASYWMGSPMFLGPPFPGGRGR